FEASPSWVRTHRPTDYEASRPNWLVRSRRARRCKSRQPTTLPLQRFPSRCRSQTAAGTPPTVWRLWGSVHLDRYSIHVAIVPYLVARHEACPLVVLALGDLHAVDCEKDVLLAVGCGNFALVIHTPPTPYLSGLHGSRIAHSGTGVGPVYDRAGN